MKSIDKTSRIAFLLITFSCYFSYLSFIVLETIISV